MRLCFKFVILYGFLLNSFLLELVPSCLFYLKSIGPAPQLASAARRRYTRAHQPTPSPTIACCLPHQILRKNKQEDHSMHSTRKEALSLYRTLLRHAETWEARNPHNTIKERQYILSQASLIRKNKDVSYEEAKELVCLLDCIFFLTL